MLLLGSLLLLLLGGLLLLLLGSLLLLLLGNMLQLLLGRRRCFYLLVYFHNNLYTATSIDRIVTS